MTLLDARMGQRKQWVEIWKCTHRLQSVKIISGPVSLPDHVRQFQILGLDISLHSLHLVDRFLRRIRFQLEAFTLVKEVEMLAPQLGVQLGESIVFVLPHFNLLLQLHNELVFRRHLQVDICADHVQFAFQRFDTL